MSTRREFVALLGAGVVTSAATMRSGKPAVVGCPVERTYVGVATVDSHDGRNKRVWLDGEDVTRDCFYADDASGTVKVYKRNEKGDYYVWGLSCDPNPATRRDNYGPSKMYHKVDRKHAWNKPYPGFGDAAYEEFTGDVRIVVL